MTTISYLLASVFLLSTALSANPQREQRHRKIHESMEKHKGLKFPYFAPSVHIGYQHPDKNQKCLAYYNEIKVAKTTKHTYFATIGFDVGYLGIQDHGSGPLAIFSVWDKGGGDNNQASVPEEDKTRVLYTNSKAKCSRFGGEGSGAKTMMPYAWEVGKTYAFLLRLTPLEKGTIYTAWIAEKGQPWQKIASYRTVVTKDRLSGFYSFVEDYRRDGHTGQKARLAYYPYQAVMTADGQWTAVTEGRGTIADDVLQNGHSGVKNGVFFSQSGAGTADYNTMPKRFSVEHDDKMLDSSTLPKN